MAGTWPARPGFVVFRNDLMELIQYSPSTDAVHSVPIIFVQAWINKYYIVDLTEETSLIRYLVGQGFTVFMISWKNPGPEMREVSFDDYMLRGALEGIEIARAICGVEQVHAVGYCVGGALLTALMAWLNAGSTGNGKNPVPVKDWTLFATMLDFSEPGEIDVYLTEDSISVLEAFMQREGYLHPACLAIGVRLLRPDVLIWRYFIHNYLRARNPRSRSISSGTATTRAFPRMRVLFSSGSCTCIIPLSGKTVSFFQTDSLTWVALSSPSMLSGQNRTTSRPGRGLSG